MTTPLLSPHEIATFLLDSGWIDKGEADRLEKRIAAYSDSRASEGRNLGIATAARKAAAVAASVKGANQRAGAQKVWRAIEALLPSGRKPRKKPMRAASRTEPNIDPNRSAVSIDDGSFGLQSLIHALDGGIAKSRDRMATAGYRRSTRSDRPREPSLLPYKPNPQVRRHPHAGRTRRPSQGSRILGL